MRRVCFNYAHTYDPANRLETAAADDSGVVWHYVYDNNGNRLQQLPASLTPTEGAIQYTYDQRGQLVQVETHDGSSFQLQAEMVYDGNGSRLQAIAYAAGSTITATYTLDPRSGLPLLVDNGTNVTMILYGQMAIGEYAAQTSEWHYYLGDAQLSVRQLVDESGIVTQAQTYGPYGVLLHQVGDGGGLFGYKGGQAAANGLWYFGNGYFDPNTGQFLATNGSPLLPLAAVAMANPAGLLFGPVLFIHWRKRRGKKGVHPATFLLLGILLAAGLSSCQNPTPIPVEVTSTPTLPPTGTPTSLPTPVFKIVITDPPTPTPTDEPTPTPSPTPTECPSTTSPWLPFPASNFKLANPFDTKDFLTLCTFGDGHTYCGLGPLGGGQGDDKHQGVDMVTTLDKQNNDSSTPTSSPTPDFRAIYMPVTATVAWKDAATFTIGLQNVKYNGVLIPGLEIGLTHIDISPVVENVELQVGTPLNTYYGAYGADFPHLHLSVRMYADQKNYSGSRTFYDPIPLLPCVYNQGGYYG